jgi:hypothetical protein
MKLVEPPGLAQIKKGVRQNTPLAIMHHYVS